MPSCIPKSDIELFEMAPPAVRNLVVKHSLKLSKVVGTGRDGRIMKEDVLSYLKEHTDSKPSYAAEAQSQAKALPLINATPCKVYFGARTSQLRTLLSTLPSNSPSSLALAFLLKALV